MRVYEIDLGKNFTLHISHSATIIHVNIQRALIPLHIGIAKHTFCYVKSTIRNRLEETPTLTSVCIQFGSMDACFTYVYDEMHCTQKSSLYCY